MPCWASEQSPQECRHCLFNAQNAVPEVDGKKSSSLKQINLKRSPSTLGPERQTKGLPHLGGAERGRSWLGKQSQFVGRD
jgi:hypothetical protein